MISHGKKGDIKECVNLHVNTLREGLFYELGKDILKKVYYTAITDPESFLIVYKERGHVNGVALGTRDINHFTKKIRNKYFFDILKGMTRLVIRKPSAIIAIIDSVFYAGKYKAELLFLFVRKEEGRKGLGTRLIDTTNKIFRKFGAKRYRVVFMDSNEMAERFYEKRGFVLSDKHNFINIRKLIYVKALV